MTAFPILLDVQRLSVSFGRTARPIPAVREVSFTIGRGEAVGLVGESGCGKSLTALSLARLLPSPAARVTGGTVEVAGQDLLKLPEPELRRWRGRRLAYVFQEPAAALNPVQTLGAQILEVLRLHRPHAATREEVARLLTMVGLTEAERVRRSFPHQVSGGMQQRVVLAMALAGEPDLLVADEPTTALDVTVQAQIMEVLTRLQRELGMALLLITHNLALVARATRRLYVMYAGRVVEEGLTRDVLQRPAHPYTRALLRAVPRLRGEQGILEGIPGSVPPVGAIPGGCAFHPRCALARETCIRSEPGWDQAGEGHAVRCHFWS